MRSATFFLRAREALGRYYLPRLLEETRRIAKRCTFSLAELRYQYPSEVVPKGNTATSWLRVLTEEGCAWAGRRVFRIDRAQIGKELQLIADKVYESYVLTVHDRVRFARQREILCQGRGSAANSAVCFALGITDAGSTCCLSVSSATSGISRRTSLASYLLRISRQTAKRSAT